MTQDQIEEAIKHQEFVDEDDKADVLWALKMAEWIDTGYFDEDV